MDTSEVWPRDNPEFTRSLIRRQARRLLRQTGMPATDLDDVEQHLTFELWKAKQSFDAARGSWQGFATTAVKQAGIKILRDRRAEKRDDRGITSLSATACTTSGETTELSQTLTDGHRGNHRGLDPLSAEIRAELSMDLAQVTATMPEDQQHLLSLCSTLTTPEVMAHTGLKRSTLHGRKLKLRAKLRSAGFEDYLEK